MLTISEIKTEFPQVEIEETPDKFRLTVPFNETNKSTVKTKIENNGFTVSGIHRVADTEQDYFVVYIDKFDALVAEIKDLRSRVEALENP